MGVERPGDRVGVRRLPGARRPDHVKRDVGLDGDGHHVDDVLLVHACPPLGIVDSLLTLASSSLTRRIAAYAAAISPAPVSACWATVRSAAAWISPSASNSGAARAKNSSGRCVGSGNCKWISSRS